MPILTEQQAKEIRDEIDQAGSTIREVERRMGVSRASLGKALRLEDPISEERLEMVFEAIDAIRSGDRPLPSPTSAQGNRLSQMAVELMTEADAPPPLSGGFDTVAWILDRQLERLARMEIQAESHRRAPAPAALPSPVIPLPVQANEIDATFAGFERICRNMFRMSPAHFEEAVRRARQAVA